MGLERDGSWKSEEDLKEVRKKAADAEKKFGFIKAAIPASNIGGVRTYVLISIMGSISGLAYINNLSPLTWIITGGFISFVVISFILNYFDKNTFGLTTEISLILNYVLSLLLFASDVSINIIVAVAVIDVLILSMKSQMRGVVSKFSGREIVDTIKFVLITAVMLPLMPDRLFGFTDIPVFGELLADMLGSEFIEATTVFNPHQIFAIIVLVVGLNFVGYFASKAIGKGKSINILALLGGLVSSTVVTENMARRSKAARNDNARDTFVAATAMTNLMSFIRILFVTFLINFELGKMLSIPMLLKTLVLIIWVVMMNLGKSTKHKVSDDKVQDIEESFEFDSPFTVGPALKFGAMYLAVVIISEVSLFYLGSSGFIVSSMIAAMTGLDAITVATATLAGYGITIELGVIVLVIASCVNLVVKVLFAAISGDMYFRKKVAKMFIVTIIVGILSMLIVIR